MRPFCPWQFLLALALLGASCARAAVTIDDLSQARSLAGEWEFSAGDDLAWADPALADSTDWEPTQVPARAPAGRVGFSGMGWYRLDIVLNTESETVRAQLGALAVTLGNVMSAYELYVNGALLGGAGSLPPTPRAAYDQRKTFAIPPSLIGDDGRLHIALRVWRDPDVGDSWESGPNYGDFLLGNIGELQATLLRKALLPNLVLASLYLVLGLYHLLIARRNPALREFFWFGLFCTALAVYTFETSQSKFFLNLPFWLHKKIEFVCLYISPVLFGMTLFAVTRSRPNILFRGFNAVFTIYAGLALLTPSMFIYHLTLRSFQYLAALWALSMMAMMVVLAFQRSRFARLIVVMLLLLVAAIFNDILLTNPLIGSGNILYIVFALILFFMALLMAERYTETLRVLELSVEERTAELVNTNRELEAAVQAKNQFLATMSHEMRTPMNAILGMTHLARQTALDAQQRDYLDKLEDAAAGLQTIIDNILDFTRLEAGDFTCNSAPFSPATLLQQLVAAWRDAAGEKQLAFSATLDPAVPAALNGDAARLSQVLGILVSNAIKFTERGQVSLAVDCTGAEEATARIRFTVSDTGIGIDENTRTQLFEAFTQADSSMSRSYGGTGMGLAIAQRLLAAMGGEITVQSAPGEGSTFRFELPLPLADEDDLPAPVEAAPASAAAADISAIRGARILLVDDSEINLQVAGELLRQAELYVDTALNGQEAVEMVRDTPYDCILMDVQMPVMDGYTATEQIRSDPANSDLPVLALTANAMPQDRVRGAEAGMNAFIAKPVDPPVLLAELLKWIPAGERGYTPAEAPSNVEQTDEAAELPASAAGLAIADGLRRVGGNSKLYMKLLNDLCNNYADSSDSLRALVAAGDSDGARQLAHKLRGIANNLGASDCGGCAERIELAIQAGDTPGEDDFRQLQAALSVVIDSHTQLASLLQPTDGATVMDAEACQSLFSRALLAVDENNPEALDMLEELIAGTGADSPGGAAFCAARDALDMYDFAGARTHLESAASAAGLQLSPS